MLVAILVGLSVLMHAAYGAGHRTVTICAGHVGDQGIVEVCLPTWVQRAADSRAERHASAATCCGHAASAGSGASHDGSSQEDAQSGAQDKATRSGHDSHESHDSSDDGSHCYCPDVLLIKLVAGSSSDQSVVELPVISMFDLTPIWACQVVLDEPLPVRGPPELLGGDDARIMHRLVVVNHTRLIL